MKVDDIRALFGRAVRTFSYSLAAVCLLATPQAFAQDSDESATVDAEDDDIEEVVVTGSRLKRDTYTSISPLQIVTGQVSREVGLIDASQILQDSTASNGFEEDLTFSGIFRADNGPGSNTINLRGLGDSRTLVLINGRRLAPAGVEGAPRSPDANLIPASLVQQYEILLDGASSVYGSDAVAGVANVILRKDFDGLELEAFSNVPAADFSAGATNTLRAAWGKNFDRGFIGIGAEYRDVEPVSLADREWLSECQKHVEITEDGEFRSVDLYWSNIFGMEPLGECAFTASANFAGPILPGFPGNIGNLIATPGRTNINIPNWSSFQMYGVNVDTDGNGVTDAGVGEINWNGSAPQQEAMIVPDLQTTNFMAFGEYTFLGDANLTPYFELAYSRRESINQSGPGQVLASVPANNPFNICNPNAANGADCGLGYNSLLDNPFYAAGFAAIQGATPAQLRDLFSFDIYAPDEGVGPRAIRTFISVRGDRDNSRTDLSQVRAVLGLKGDMPFMNFGSFEDWSFDFYYSDSEADGDSSRFGIREDRLDLALGNFSTTDSPCVNDTGAELASDTAAGCVPVNVFAPSLYANVASNNFASAAERAYLFDSRDFRTKYRQRVASFYTNGEIFELPGGEALFGIGLEYRDDEIESLPDEVAAEGLFVNFFADKGAVGAKYTREVFAELELPLLADVTAFEELTINVSSRYTEDEFYGGAWTYATKLAWRPIDSLLLRGTVGTSYRAPNLRENFLAGQTGFVTISDPCVIPQEAFDDINGYIPENDNREPQVLENCQANGVDPFTFDNDGFVSYGAEIKEGGATDLAEENSESFSAGLVFDQPWFAGFDLTLGATYYEIKIRDEIISPFPSFIIGDCYGDIQGDSGFCSRIQRDSETNEISLIDIGFINRDQLKARGVDINMRWEKPAQMFGRAVDLGADFVFNRNLELSTRLLDGGDDSDETEFFQGELAYPEWNGRMTFRADVGDYRFTFSTRYLSSVKQDPAFVDDFDGVFTGLADTCLGAENGDVNCRDYADADNYFTHDVSVYYFGDVWTLGAGIRNLTHQAPPYVDGQEVNASINNRPFSSGYDLLGRTLFLNVEYNW